jgi:transposase
MGHRGGDSIPIESAGALNRGLAPKERHLIGCFFNTLKRYRRRSSPFEKTARNFTGFLQFAAALIGTHEMSTEPGGSL